MSDSGAPTRHQIERALRLNDVVEALASGVSYVVAKDKREKSERWFASRAARGLPVQARTSAGHPIDRPCPAKHKRPEWVPLPEGPNTPEYARGCTSWQLVPHRRRDSTGDASRRNDESSFCSSEDDSGRSAPPPAPARFWDIPAVWRKTTPTHPTTFIRGEKPKNSFDPSGLICSLSLSSAFPRSASADAAAAQQRAAPRRAARRRR
jgi:hypothetical protein